MKKHHRIKLHHLHNGREFYSEKEQGDNYYHLIPHIAGFYELYMNNEYKPSILVHCLKDSLISFGIGDRNGYSKAIHLDDVQFLDLNFVDESNFVEEDYSENFTASFDGQEVFLFAGDETKPDRFHIENSIG